MTLDAFDCVDLSGSDPSGRVGAMARRLSELHAQEYKLLMELRQVRISQRIALDALDRFIA